MKQTAAYEIRRNRLSFAVSLAVASLVAGNMAIAQENQASAPAAAATADESPVAKVEIVGTRASQQSSIDRKKNAATAIDSIVAEDVGSLPDRNIGEAISRMSGVALDRGDFGEGVSVAVRGNGPDLTRVEIDGQGVQSAGGTDMSGGGNGRGSEFRQLSADLIKSVDVVKGSTADMTEGSLGGGIVIKTRTGLDFKKPFASLRIAESQSSLNKSWQPNANLVLADKFLDGRLGVVLNASHQVLANEAHSVQVANAARSGYYRLLDFDNSPEKTFTYQPGTMTDDVTTRSPMLQSPLTAGGFFSSASPYEVLTKSAAAKTKADCYTAFPQLTTAQTNLITSAARGAAQSQRNNELFSCLNQWNDYTPSNLRYFVKREFDKRQNLDLRTDFKVNKNLTVYAKGSFNRRYDDMHQMTYNLGGVKVNPSSVFSPTYNGPAFIDDTKAGTRIPAPGSGYYAYNTPSQASNTYLSSSVANIIPGSIVYDANHHLTKFTITDAAATTDQLHEYAKTTAKYLQLGGTYKNGRLTTEFFVGDAKSDFERAQKRVSFNNYYGETTLSVLPNGLWGYSFPAGSSFDQGNPAQYGTLFPGVASSAVKLSATNTRAMPAYTAAQQPLLTQQPSTYYNPRIMESEERTAKLDLTYAVPDSIPFFKRFKAGFNLRDNIKDSWDPNSGNNGGFTVKAAIGTFGAPDYIPAVVLPSVVIRSTFNGCQDTPGSLGPGGNACQFGFLPGADPRRGLDGNTTLTVQQWNDMVQQSLKGNVTPTQFFSGANGRPAGLLNNWVGIDVDKVFELVNTPHTNFDCVKKCTASDGKVYDQPQTHLTERTQAFYVMGDFGLDHIPFTSLSLPFGWELEGNMGYRYVKTRVRGTGMMTLTSITPIPGQYNPALPTAPGGTVTSSVSQAVSINDTSHDFMPIYNLAMWLVPDKLVARYNRAKTVARPPINYLMPSGTCTYDATLVDKDPAASQTCSGTIGNPALQAQMNVNQNLSFEFYPNKDTMFSIAGFQQEGRIGAAVSRGVSKLPLAGGSGLVDPVTGVALSDVDFNYSLWQNGATTTRKGVEFGTKTAFTFLPWFLRYTGFDANYTKLRSATTSENVVDLLTGTPLPPARESKYSYNWALWYDDGKLSARVAMQAVASYFNCIAGCGSIDNYDYAANGVTSGMIRFPYNPGSPNFKDSTRFIDGKISYKVKPGIEVFVEGRNLGNATTSTSQAQFAGFSDGTPNLLDYGYAGRRVMIGVNLRTL
ncbi:TonB-dependent receptor [Massilia horti]|uniref:TonB-dependent receptor n=1 Tax=Massilia horti TaxID=2562153 RepID=A0A4Y9T3I0_9BURK|nr:TonB-dependent receptor [Massilia horti]TFW32649.1 TonB-dependent receptor [Massilia horti]